MSALVSEPPHYTVLRVAGHRQTKHKPMIWGVLVAHAGGTASMWYPDPSSRGTVPQIFIKLAQAKNMNGFTVRDPGNGYEPGWSQGCTAIFWALALQHAGEHYMPRGINELPLPPDGWPELLRKILSRGPTSGPEQTPLGLSPPLPLAPSSPLSQPPSPLSTHRQRYEHSAPPDNQDQLDQTITLLNECSSTVCIRKSHIHDLLPGRDMGVFAITMMRTDFLIAEYTGEFLTQDELDARYPGSTTEAAYAFALRNGGYLDAIDPNYATAARWINHSKHPNAAVTENIDGTLEIRATDTITPGEEILIDYNPGSSHDGFE